MESTSKMAIKFAAWPSLKVVMRPIQIGMVCFRAVLWQYTKHDQSTKEKIFNKPSAASTFSSTGAFSSSRAGSSGIVSVVPWAFFSSVSWTASSFSSSLGVSLTGTEASGSSTGALTLSSLISPSSGSVFSFGAALALLLFSCYYCTLSLYYTLLLLKRFPISKNQKNKFEKAAFFCESNSASGSK